MKKYEAMFVLDNGFAGKDWEPVEKQLRETFERFGAQVESVAKWGERRLAYEIKKHRRATYAHALFEMDPERVSELRDHYALDERILRLLILLYDPNAQTHLKLDTSLGAMAKRASGPRPGSAGPKTPPASPSEKAPAVDATPDTPVAKVETVTPPATQPAQEEAS